MDAHVQYGEITETDIAALEHWYSLEADVQAHTNFLSHVPGILDPTEHDCDFCGERHGGYDLLLHIHIVHKLEQSDICPCEDCILNKLIRFVEEDVDQIVQAESAEDALSHTAVETVSSFTPQPSQKTTTTSEMHNTVSHTGVGTVSSFTPQQPQRTTSTSEMHGTASPSVVETTRSFIPHPPQKATSTSEMHGTASPSVVETTRSFIPHPPQKATSTSEMHNTVSPKAVERMRPLTLQPPQNPTSASEMHNTVSHSAVEKMRPLIPQPPQKTFPTSEMYNTVSPSAVETMRPSIPQPPQKTILTSERATSIRKSHSPQPNQLLKVPNTITFHSYDPQIQEKNLSYEMSLIEMGELHKDPSGGVHWINKLETAPAWIDGSDQPVKSRISGNPMSWLPFLPHEIDPTVPGWQLVYWYRYAAAQSTLVAQRDIFDRLPGGLSHSGLTNKMQYWQRSVGMLPQTTVFNYSWPSKQAMETVANLSGLQLKFNTWWDVQYLPSKGIYMARQPSKHWGYRDPHSVHVTSKQPWYVIENPEQRQMSEHVKLLDDAMMFLTIKAEESGFEDGFAGIMAWLLQKPETDEDRELFVDLVLEFRRWRKGAPDTPSIPILRAALEQAGSQAESEAIKQADYSMTPWLQNVVGGLGPVRKSRRQEDKKVAAEIKSKIANRKGRKRANDEVEDAETNADGNKHQAT